MTTTGLTFGAPHVMPHYGLARPGPAPNFPHPAVGSFARTAGAPRRRPSVLARLLRRG